MAVRMVSTSEPATADQKPWTAKPGVTSEASSTERHSPPAGRAQRQKRNGKSQKLEHRPDGGIDDGDHDGGDERRAEVADFDPGTICATSQSARALTNQLTMRCSIWTLG